MKIRLSNLLSANRIRLLYLLILVLPSVRPVSADSLDDVHFKYASRHMWGKQYLDFRPDLEDWSRSGGVQYESSWGGLFQTDNRQSNGGDIIPLSLYPARLNELLPFPEKTPDTFIDNFFNGSTWTTYTKNSYWEAPRTYYTMSMNQIRVWAVVDSPAIDTIRIPVLQVDADFHGGDYRCISFAEFVIPKGDTVSKPCDLVDRTEIEYEDIVDSKQWHNLWLPLAIVFGNSDESNFGNVVSWSLAQRVYAERGLPNWVNSLDLDEVLPMLNLTWKAIGPGGTVIKGPSGLGESVWPEAATSAITSKPGIYTIICTVQLGNGQKIDITSIVNLLPVEVAPEVLAVNSDFDEGRIDSATGYAIPDCDDMPGVDQKTGSGNTQIALNASRAHLDGLFANDEKVTDDMHKGWFGVNPNQLGDDFWSGANVTIRKIDKIDSDTGYKESGQVRFYAKWSSGYYGISPYDFQTLQPVNLVSAGVNLRPNEGVYGSTSTIPDGAEFYMEGVRPGKITLEWRLQKGTIDVKHEQTFLVATQKTKQAWIDEVIYQVKLQTSDLGSDIDLNDYDPANGFFLPNSNNYKYIQTVYYYYMQLFQQYPERFYWAGMAKTAGASVYAGMVDMATWKTSVFVSNQDVDKVLIDFMIQGNKDIFTDMAWAHHAYAASGIEALDYVKSEEGVETTNFDAWTLVHEGIQENDITKLRDGNQRILRREQQVVMPPLYDTMKEVWLDPGTRLEQFLATDLAGISYPPKNAAGKINIDEMFSINSRNPVQYQLGPSLRQVVPNGKLSDFDDRWAWIDNTQNGMLQIWLGTSTSVPGFTENERSNINGSDLTEHAKIYSMLPTLGGLRDNQFPPPPW